MHVRKRTGFIWRRSKQFIYADYFVWCRMKSAANRTEQSSPILVICIVFHLRQFRLHESKHFQIVRYSFLKIQNGEFAALLQCPKMMCEQLSWVHVTAEKRKIDWSKSNSMSTMAILTPLASLYIVQTESMRSKATATLCVYLAAFDNKFPIRVATISLCFPVHPTVLWLF